MCSQDVGSQIAVCQLTPTRRKETSTKANVLDRELKLYSARSCAPPLAGDEGHLDPQQRGVSKHRRPQCYYNPCYTDSQKRPQTLGNPNVNSSTPAPATAVSTRRQLPDDLRGILLSSPHTASGPPSRKHHTLKPWRLRYPFRV